MNMTNNITLEPKAKPVAGSWWTVVPREAFTQTAESLFKLKRPDSSSYVTAKDSNGQAE
jgi:hypothetical protein